MTKKDYVRYFEMNGIGISIRDVVYYGDDERHNDIHLLGGVSSRDGRYYIFNGGKYVWQVPADYIDRNGHVVLEKAAFLIAEGRFPIVPIEFLKQG